MHVASHSIVAESTAGLPTSLSGMLPGGMSTRLAALPRDESIEGNKGELTVEIRLHPSPRLTSE